MPKADKDHFNSYKDQTRIKHQILSEYLSPFFKIQLKYYNNLLYIDGFAGAGQYTDKELNDTFDGSPLIALKILAHEEGLSKAVRTFFVEPREDHFTNLSECATRFYNDNKHLHQPILIQSDFQDTIQSIKQYLDDNDYKLAPTFLFVDPCGVHGVHFESVVDILKRPNCEAFIFFNITGVQRIAGLGPDKIGQTLYDLLGSSDRVDQLMADLGKCSSPIEKETAVISAYCDAISTEAKAEYVLPFRVEAENKRSTSHYFIHGTKHHLGFKIMKEIMWKAGRIDGTDEGRLELLQSSAGDVSSLMRSDLEQADLAILEHLRSKGKTKVSVFREEWPLRPEDRFTDACYRRRLLHLEANGSIRVYGADSTTLKPASDRPRRQGVPTLSVKNYVEIV